MVQRDHAPRTSHGRNESAEGFDQSAIGPKLRVQRERLGLGLRELARRIGLSASLISQIERGRVNPSVSTLYALARELRIPIGALFAEEDGRWTTAPRATPVLTPEDRTAITLGAGVTGERLMPAADSTIEFLRLVYEVGSESSPEDSLARHRGKEYGYVISGRLGVRIGFEQYELAAGDSISFNSSAPHRLWAIGESSAETIWAVVGRQNNRRCHYE